MRSGIPADGIVDAIGSTPLVRMRRYPARDDLEVWAKLESANPGGSSKDRSAFQVVADAMRDGRVGPGTTIVESTSGNLGVGLAQVCRYFGLDLICIVDSRAHRLNVGTMRALGADVRVVDDADDQDPLALRLETVRELLEQLPNAFWPNQYENHSSISAHSEGTMREIDRALDGRLDYVFVATSTTGTLRGCGDFLARHRRRTRLIAVDAAGSVLFGGRRARRVLPGFGAGVATGLSRGAWFDRLIRVEAFDCVVGCRRLVEREAIFVGASSGGVAAAFNRLAPELEPGSRCALVFADGGAGYLDTVYSDEWVAAELGADAGTLRTSVEGLSPTPQLST